MPMATKDTDTSKVEKQEDATEVETEDTTEESTEEAEDSTSTTTDYEAIIVAERERAEKAEKALAEYSFKERKAKREEPEEIDDVEDKPLTTKDLQRLLQREREVTKKEFEQERALEYARKNTSSEQEAQAAILYWKNRVIPTGNLEEDLSFAIAGLTHKKTVAKNAELARAVKGKQAANTKATGTHHDGTDTTASRIDAGTEASYKRAGFAYDSKDRMWKKKLPNGNFLIKDPKTKAIRIQKAS